MNKESTPSAQLNQRSCDVFRALVDSYLETGLPVGSKTVAGLLNFPLSSASVRNIMADLEKAGLLTSPHTSAGRIPTEKGLKLFVDGLLEIGALESSERQAIEARCSVEGVGIEDMLSRATAALSGLSRCAGVVVAPKLNQTPLKHIEFVPLDARKALVVTVGTDGTVENKVIDVPPGTLPSSLTEAGNYLTRRLQGRTLDEARAEIESETRSNKALLDKTAANLVSQGIAAWSGDRKNALIVKGRSNLLNDVQAVRDLDRIKLLFDELETQETMSKLLDLTKAAEGIQIYIGAENALFRLSGCSVITAPYRDSREKIVGAIGIIGPTRMNYARLIPLVDYTSQVISKLIG